MAGRTARCDVLAVSSTGGHWTELMLLKPAFDGLSMEWATSDCAGKNGVPVDHLHELIDANLRTPLKAVRCAFQAFRLVFRLRPRLVVSTGAAPGLFVAAWGRLMGARVLWVEIVGVTSLTVSGRIARRFADRFVVQWPEMVDGPDVIHFGSLL